jgi:hypothetical protein
LELFRGFGVFNLIFFSFFFSFPLKPVEAAKLKTAGVGEIMGAAPPH